MWKLNNIELNKHCIKEEIIKEIGKYFVIYENKKIQQTYMMQLTQYSKKFKALSTYIRKKENFQINNLKFPP